MLFLLNIIIIILIMSESRLKKGIDVESLPRNIALILKRNPDGLNCAMAELATMGSGARRILHLGGENGTNLLLTYHNPIPRLEVSIISPEKSLELASLIGRDLNRMVRRG